MRTLSRGPVWSPERLVGFHAWLWLFLLHLHLMQASRLNLSFVGEHAERREDAGKMPNLRDCLSNFMEFHDQLWEALYGTTSEKKRGIPSRTGGGRRECSGGFECLELCCFGGSQPYSQGEFQEKLLVFPGRFGIYPEFPQQSPSMA